MTTSRLATLVAFMALGIATVSLLPKGSERPPGVRAELPYIIGKWIGTAAEISEKERNTLGVAGGTQIVRKTYRSPEGYELTVSIVISGRDMSTAIHRPERCLEAQGYALMGSDEFAVSLPQRGIFPVTQLRSTAREKTGDGTITRELLAFYWFVGERDICASHWKRMALDNGDRFFRGVSQHWAYILVSGGVPLPKDPARSEAMRKWAQDAARDFIRTLAPKIHLDTVRYN